MRRLLAPGLWLAGSLRQWLLPRAPCRHGCNWRTRRCGRDSWPWRGACSADGAEASLWRPGRRGARRHEAHDERVRAAHDPRRRGAALADGGRQQAAQQVCRGFLAPRDSRRQPLYGLAASAVRPGRRAAKHPGGEAAAADDRRRRRRQRPAHQAHLPRGAQGRLHPASNEGRGAAAANIRAGAEEGRARRGYSPGQWRQKAGLPALHGNGVCGARVRGSFCQPEPPPALVDARVEEPFFNEDRPLARRQCGRRRRRERGPPGVMQR